ncbi:MAG: L-threonylcarbamoyladenylate synthase [Acidimicrobiia bacterium]|nr:L-threonylcarbamoyladenylate synthase [Acidimicrobiia bacterium]MYC57163.1 L-threonylcarbamoyladenylate synthase [Acidimicrobiia bacterium]MYG93910.1 L-threonylcarbamoyladenylate synthase [Acidimicrobiia bacterium]MYI29913.1 L-threonylcarbamoyladenylate synthase [Acidimicrobiia bacterium]
MQALVQSLQTLSRSNQAELVKLAAAELRAARAVIIPTDTVYGLAVLPDNTDLLFELKQRPTHKAVAILVARPVDAEMLFNPFPTTRRLMEQHWPGALTIVQDGCGVRCPDHPLVQALASVVGPVATTSANLSGQPTPHTAAEASAPFPAVQLVIDGGRLRAPASTVVEVAQDGLYILRQGVVEVA